MQVQLTEADTGMEALESPVGVAHDARFSKPKPKM